MPIIGKVLPQDKKIAVSTSATFLRCIRRFFDVPLPGRRSPGHDGRCSRIDGCSIRVLTRLAMEPLTLGLRCALCFLQCGYMRQ
jgi:hypothetical protein